MTRASPRRPRAPPPHRGPPPSSILWARPHIIPYFTDTYLLGKNETARVALVADNPGLWMFHCHVIDHMETGLMGTIAVGEAWCG